MAVMQRERLIRLASPLEEDRLLVATVRGREALSELFRFELELVSEDDAIDFDDLVGHAVRLDVELADGSERYLSGFISEFSRGHEQEGLVQYGAVVVPWLWFLTRTSDSRIFQNKSVPDIVTQIFEELGFADYKLNLSRDYPERVYCVQYRETDFNFVSRLLEEEGIFYYFEHESDRHVLVLSDKIDEGPACPGSEAVRYHRGDVVEEDDTITEFRESRHLRSGRVALEDWNFETPSTDLEVGVDSLIRSAGNDALELYDYPASYGDLQEGERYNRLRIEEEEAQHRRFAGVGTCRGFTSGHRFDLERHFRPEVNQGYALLAVEHEGRNTLPHQETDVAGYDVTFVCLPDSVPFRPPRRTPKPVVQGPQTAIVVGPPGEEIHVDKYGRIKVQFHWDREGRRDEKSSCWMRVAQSWASQRWGGIVVPRVGMEVVVEFLEGDPDRPLITGCVYNAEAMPPYDLPDEQTKSTFKTYSSKGGEGFNELRFEDRKGEEQIFVHAEKNQDIRIKNDLYEWVGRNDHKIVKQDQFTRIENNRNETVDNDHLEAVGNDRNLKVGGKEAKEVASSLSLKVGGDVVEVFQGDHSEEVTGDLYVKGRNVVIEGMMAITLKVGGNAVVIDQAGITISSSALVTIMGSLVNINSGPGSPPGMGMPGFAVPPARPQEPEEADIADPGEMARQKAEQKEKKTGKYGAEVAEPFKAGGPAGGAAAGGGPGAGDEAEKKSFVEVELVDDEGNPVPGEKYRVKLPDGRVKEGTLDGSGFARVDGVEPGQCEITFPDLDRDAWG